MGSSSGSALPPVEEEARGLQETARHRWARLGRGGAVAVDEKIQNLQWFRT